MDVITIRGVLKDLALPDWVYKAAEELGLTEDCTYVRKGLVPSDVQFKADERASVDYITTRAVDRDHEIILPEGGVLDHYRNHPIVLWAHDYQALPVGKALWIKADERGLISKTKYAKHAKAEEIYQYRREGFPLAKSVGVLPLEVVEWKDFGKLDIEKMRLDKGATDTAERIYTKWLLLEYSDVPVPSNPEALQLAISKGLTSYDEARKLYFFPSLKAAKDEGATGGVEDAKVKVPARDLPLNMDVAWDAAAADARVREWARGPDKDQIDWAKYGQAFAWVGEDRESFGGYKLQFADIVDGELTAVWRGVVAVVAALNGARGGVDIPQADKARVHALMASYYARTDQVIPPLKGEQPATKAEYDCVCLACGARAGSGIACALTKCPECGEIMAEYQPEQTEETAKAVSRSAPVMMCAELQALPVVKQGRWNTTLSKAFDVEHTRLAPAGKKLALIAGFLQCEMAQMVTHRQYLPSAELGQNLKAVHETLAVSELKGARNIETDGDERPLEYATVALNSREAEEFLVNGCEFRLIEGAPAVLDYQPSWEGLHITWYYKRADSGTITKTLQAVEQWSAEHLLLKGEKFALSGCFISDPGVGLGDLFLSEDNRTAIENIVKVVKRGEQALARGYLIAGVPGTGKTLAGRVVLHEVPEATFIWVSARDFAYAGASGGLDYAFQLAQRLAPTVLFIEDIDSWLSGQAIDIVKGSMDGLVQMKGVVTVLTTNTPDRFPDALIDRPGRFHEVLEFGLPDEPLRKVMLTTWVGGQVIDDEVLGRLVRATEGFSGAYMAELVAYALRLMEDGGPDALPEALDIALTKLVNQKQRVAGWRGVAAVEQTLQLETIELKEVTPLVERPTVAAVEKEGRILSAKNRATIKTAIDAMNSAEIALNELLNATAPVEEHWEAQYPTIAEPREERGATEDVQQSVLRALTEAMHTLRAEVVVPASVERVVEHGIKKALGRMF